MLSRGTSLVQLVRNRTLESAWDLTPGLRHLRHARRVGIYRIPAQHRHAGIASRRDTGTRASHPAATPARGHRTLLSNGLYSNPQTDGVCAMMA